MSRQVSSNRTGYGLWGIALLSCLTVALPDAWGQGLGAPETVSDSLPLVYADPTPPPREKESVWGSFVHRLTHPFGWGEPKPEDDLSMPPQKGIFTNMGRSLGLVETPKPVLVQGADGRWVPSGDRATDRDHNQEFLQAEDLFRKEDYGAARKAFKSLSKKYKDRPLEEDILFMLAESEFKLDRLPAAQDAYHRLLTKYPTTRYMPQAVQRTYDIAYYWLEDSRLRAEGKPGKYGFSRFINFFDRTRPVFDSPGRALETVEMIQQYDPFGPLTDDAVMMAAGHNFISDRYVQAAGYYEQLITDQPRSEHSGKAKILAEQAYLRSYRGPQYDASDLDGAYRMAQISLNTTEGMADEQRRRLEADLRAIYLERAKRDYTMGEDFRKRWLYTSAKYYYHLVIKDFPDTDWARLAEERLNELGDRETEKWEPADWLRNPWKKLSPAPSFARRVEQGSTEDGTVPAIDDAAVQTPDAPDSRPSLLNLRNWLDQL